MTFVRAARPEDAAELVRLRRLMFAAMHGRDEPGAWEGVAREQARHQLAEAERVLGAFVVDTDEDDRNRVNNEGSGEDGSGEGDSAGGRAVRLAACAVGRIEERLSAPSHPLGRFGFVFNVYTDPDYRGRGYARATTEALLGWFAERGVTRVDLHATDEAEGLYRGLGFAEHSIALSADLSRRGT